MNYRIILILLCWLLSAQVSAIRLTVVTEDLYPYNYIENGELKGQATEIVVKVLKHAGIDYSIQVYPWARAYNLALNNKNVLIYSIVKIPSREKLF